MKLANIFKKALNFRISIELVLIAIDNFILSGEKFI